MALHEGDDFEEGWFLHDHTHTHQRYVPSSSREKDPLFVECSET